MERGRKVKTVKKEINQKSSFIPQTAIESTDSLKSLSFKCDVSYIKCSSCNYSGFVFFSNLLPQDSSTVLKTHHGRKWMWEKEDLKESFNWKSSTFFLIRVSSPPLVIKRSLDVWGMKNHYHLGFLTSLYTTSKSPTQTWSWPSCTYTGVPTGYLFHTQWCTYVVPNLPVPTPLPPVSTCPFLCVFHLSISAIRWYNKSTCLITVLLSNAISIPVSGWLLSSKTPPRQRARCWACSPININPCWAITDISQMH